MAIAALIALFPLLFLFAPRLALGLLALAILLLYQKRAAAARRTATARLEEEAHRGVPWKDPWSTGGLDR